jgi:hypothetical protein
MNQDVGNLRRTLTSPTAQNFATTARSPSARCPAQTRSNQNDPFQRQRIESPFGQSFAETETIPVKRNPRQTLKSQGESKKRWRRTRQDEQRCEVTWSSRGEGNQTQTESNQDGSIQKPKRMILSAPYYVGTKWRLDAPNRRPPKKSLGGQKPLEKTRTRDAYNSVVTKPNPSESSPTRTTRTQFETTQISRKKSQALRKHVGTTSSQDV